MSCDTPRSARNANQIIKDMMRAEEQAARLRVKEGQLLQEIADLRAELAASEARVAALVRHKKITEKIHALFTDTKRYPDPASIIAALKELFVECKQALAATKKQKETTP
jgi:hypothetical protein